MEQETKSGKAVRSDGTRDVGLKEEVIRQTGAHGHPCVLQSHTQTPANETFSHYIWDIICWSRSCFTITRRGSRQFKPRFCTRKGKIPHSLITRTVSFSFNFSSRLWRNHSFSRSPAPPNRASGRNTELFPAASTESFFNHTCNCSSAPLNHVQEKKNHVKFGVTRDTQS